MLAREHLAQITDPANVLDNPFAMREARRDGKRKQPATAYAWMLGTLSVLFGASLWGIFWLRDSDYGIPWYLGGSAGTTLCISICGFHALFISGAARKHSALLLWQEAQRNTLPGLLTLPTPPFKLLMQAGIYPWFAGMRLALAGLPFYLICVAAGGFTWIDLLLLYVVFSLVAISFPIWVRPILDDSAMFPVAPAQARSGAGSAGVQAAQASGSAGLGPGAAWAFIAPMIMMPLIMPLILRGGIPGLYSEMSRYAPHSILDLLPTFMISWPLLMARALITPFDWFGWPLPPLPFVLTWYAFSRYLSLVRSSEYLSVGTYRYLARQPTYEKRRVWEFWLRTGLFFVVCGYAWKWGVVNGGLAPLAPPGIPAKIGAVGAFLYGLLFSLAFRWLGRVRALAGWRAAELWPSRLSKSAVLVVNRLTRKDALRFLAAPPLVTAGLFMAACLIGRLNPFSAPLMLLAGKMALIVAAAAALQYSFILAIRVSTSLPGFCLLLLICFGPQQGLALAPLSPLLGLLVLGPPSLLGLIRIGGPPPPGLLALLAHKPQWWLWPLACGAAAVLVAAWIPARQRSSRSNKAASEHREESVESSEVLVVNPTRVGPEVYSDAVLGKREDDSKRESPIGLLLLSLSAKLTDNAVAIKELRSKLRGKLSPSFLRGSALAFTVVSLGLLSAPAFTMAIGGGPAALLFGPVPNPMGQLAASILSLAYSILIWVSMSAGLSILPQVFAPEREKSMLGFLLLTPMKTAAIIRGKAVGLLIPASVFSGLLAAALFVFSLLFSPSIGLALAVSVWIRCIALCAALTVTAGSVSIAMAALFPRSISQAGCGALLNGLMMQIPIQLILHMSRSFRRAGLGAAPPQSILNNSLMWIICLAATLIICVTAYLVAGFGVWKMRRKDIAFESSRQEN